jgi:hypothetical protein
MLKNNLEFIFILAISIVVLLALVFNGSYMISLYESNGVNGQIFQFSGVLFGLFLTAYAIFASFIPTSRIEFLKSTVFSKVETSFLLALIITIVSTALSLIIFFVQNPIRNFLIYFQITLFISAISLSIIIVLALYGLIRYMRQNLIVGNH